MTSRLGTGNSRSFFYGVRSLMMKKKLLGFDCYTVANLKQNSVNGAECTVDGMKLHRENTPEILQYSL